MVNLIVNQDRTAFKNTLFVDTYDKIRLTRTLSAPTIDMMMYTTLTEDKTSDEFIVIDEKNSQSSQKIKQQNQNCEIYNSDQEGKSNFREKNNENVHLLKCEHAKYEMEIKWKQTKGSVEHLLSQNILKTDVIVPVSEKELVDTDENKVCIISGPPGIGKSTILKSIYDKHKEKDSSCVCIRVNLNENMLQEQFEKNKPIDFLIKHMLKDEDEFIKELVTYNQNIIIFFDSFDEITSNNENCMYFMEELVNVDAIKKIYITTRPNYKEKLEKNMNVLAYTINKFTTEEEKKYLCEYYKNKYTGKDEKEKNEKVKIYIEELIKVLHDHHTTEHFSLIGNPLLLSMAARIFEKNNQTYKCECDSLEKFVEGKSDKPTISLTYVNLYTLYSYYENILYANTTTK